LSSLRPGLDSLRLQGFSFSRFCLLLVALSDFARRRAAPSWSFRFPLSGLQSNRSRRFCFIRSLAQAASAPAKDFSSARQERPGPISLGVVFFFCRSILCLDLICFAAAILCLELIRFAAAGMLLVDSIVLFGAIKTDAFLCSALV
jgi:hypothetical protein